MAGGELGLCIAPPRLFLSLRTSKGTAMPQPRHVRCLSFILIALVALGSAADFAIAQVYVRGYTKSNGTYVAPHYRSSPDGNFSNNWSTKGNVNPYTGELGTRVTPPTNNGNSYHGGGSLSSVFASSSHFGRGTSRASISGWTDNQFYRGDPAILLTPAEPHDERLKDVGSMNYHGIGFSTTHQQFLKLYPNAKPAGPSDSAGVTSYAIEDLDQKRDAVWFQFLDGQMLRLVFAYGETRLREYGGTRVLDDRAKERFGTPTREEGLTNVWEFPTVDRLVMTSMDGNSWYLAVTQLSAQKTVNSKRAKVDVGF
jgi:hypothetical protein